MSDDKPSPASTTLGMLEATVTRVPWTDVTGAQLEELLYGLLDAMGASSLTWRAGCTTGVTAADGGRDLEAVFDRPSPDGELDRRRWWVECKGRKETVERGAVQQAILDASARADIDVLVVATNSHFSNPTRDWVSERTRSFARPVVKLWDRDNLNRLVRQYSTVVARVLPSVLSNGDRLQLLVTRFEELGEEPMLLDLEFFWERRAWLMEQQSDLFTRAVAMFLYAEGVALPRRRPWWRLLQESDAPVALIWALVQMPSLFGGEPLSRPLEIIRVLASAGRILIACLLLLSDRIGIEMTLNPWRCVIGGDEVADNEEKLEAWRQGALLPVLAFVQSDLVDACASDCTRASAKNPHEMDSLTPK
jgi:Restriction endonuclease